MLALVGKDDTIALAAAGIEVECAEIYPSAAAHSLVDSIVSFLPLVSHDVFCIVNTLSNRLITDVNGIATRGRNVGNEAYAACCITSCGATLARSASLEGVLAIIIYARMPCKTWQRCTTPLMFAR